MTPSQVVDLALDILASHGLDAANVAKSVLFTRISQKQRELFTWVATVDPDFYGECATATLDVNGDANLNVLEATVPPDDPYPIEKIQIIRIFDVGTRGADYTVDQRVRIVRPEDIRDLPPRVTLRNMVLRSVGTDLAGVVSVRVWYSRRPRAIGITGTGVIELIEPFDALLSLDLARTIAERYPDAAAAPALAYVGSEEAKLMAAFEAHIKQTYSTVESRFTQPPAKPVVAKSA